MKWRCRANWPDTRPEWGEVKKLSRWRGETYAVTPSGEVFILDEYGQWERRPQYLHPDGYMSVNITRRSIGLLRVNRAVCTAYHGDPKPGQVAGHMNSNRTDNSRWNLKWITHSDNVRQAQREGRHASMTRPAIPRGRRRDIRHRNGRLEI